MIDISAGLLVAKAKEQLPYTHKVYEMLHQNPEPSGEERQTAAFIRQELAALGLDTTPVLDNGTLALLDTGRPGKTLLLRADIDALPVQEDECNLSGKKPLVSGKPGVCHACGHDGHTATLLTVARILCGLKEQLCGKIWFYFEQGEERLMASPVNAKMPQQLGLDAAYAIHYYADMPCGRISIEKGPRMSGVYGFEYTFQGKGGHSSRPDQAKNPLMCAVKIAQALDGLSMLCAPPGEFAVFSLGMLDGGAQVNVIPDTARLAGTIRYFEPDVGRRMVDRLHETVEAHLAAADCRVTGLVEMIAPPVVNDAGLSQLASEAIAQVLGPDVVTAGPRWMGSESFGSITENVPSMFAFVGAANEQKGCGAAHHNPRFQLDTDALELGVLSGLAFAVRFLGQQGC